MHHSASSGAEGPVLEDEIKSQRDQFRETLHDFLETHSARMNGYGKQTKLIQYLNETKEATSLNELRLIASHVKHVVSEHRHTSGIRGFFNRNLKLSPKSESAFNKIELFKNIKAVDPDMSSRILNFKDRYHQTLDGGSKAVDEPDQDDTSKVGIRRK
ncbi:hypothetical protein [Legionella drancourtii]|uniref:Uncharacterized protein n=1 Tax=Legionella drancourtii LLAP12 TaxID=658187 RepID=G9EIL9_9GAMM|nr:hypothetical protein [Legionella drancourtii]EHL32787.1 hypothetical protein LDG_5024 [Legionella drancourtii LLAP12]